MPDLHLLTGAYAVDALSPVERAGFERHLRSCGSCAAEVIELQEAAAKLADRVATPPPPGLRERVLLEVSRTRQLPPHERFSLRRPALRQLMVAAAAAVLVASAAGLGGLAWQQHRSAENDRIEAAAEARKQDQILQLVMDPRGSQSSGQLSVGGEATVVAVDGRAAVMAEELPPPPDGRAYQLWVIRGSEVRSGGMLDLQAGKGESLLTGVAGGDTVAVTIEPEGGSRQPSMKPIVAIPVT